MKAIKTLWSFLKDSVHVMTCDGWNCSWMDEKSDDDWALDSPVDKKDNQVKYYKKEYINGTWVTIRGK